MGGPGVAWIEGEGCQKKECQRAGHGTMAALR